MYALGKIYVVRLSDSAHIPMVVENRDYREYLEWVDAGNIPEEIPEIIPPVEVITVSAWKIRKALNQLSLRTLVEDAIAQADQDTKDAWEYATEFERNHPLVETLGMALKKTSEDLDQIFTLAKSL